MLIVISGSQLTVAGFSGWKKSKVTSVEGKAHVKLIYLKKNPLKRSIVLSLITLPNADNTELLHRKEVREMTPFHMNKQVAWA